MSADATLSAARQDERIHRLEERLLLAAADRKTAKECEADFNEYVLLTHGKYLGKALRVTRDFHSAEDAVQDAYVALHERLFAETVARDGLLSLGSWLTRVTMNKASDLRRQIHRHGLVSLDRAREADILRLESCPLETAEAVQEAWKRVGSLPAKQRQAYILRVFEGREYAEIGEWMHISSATAEQYYYKAFMRLRRK